MQRDFRIEIDGCLPVAVRHELDRRFGPVEIHEARDVTVLAVRGLDQSALRALLDVLWDAAAQIRTVITIRGGSHVSH
jgi:hypothetical protein